MQVSRDQAISIVEARLPGFGKALVVFEFLLEDEGAEASLGEEQKHVEHAPKAKTKAKTNGKSRPATKGKPKTHGVARRCVKCGEKKGVTGFASGDTACRKCRKNTVRSASSIHKRAIKEAAALGLEFEDEDEQKSFEEAMMDDDVDGWMQLNRPAM